MRRKSSTTRYKCKQHYELRKPAVLCCFVSGFQLPAPVNSFYVMICSEAPHLYKNGKESFSHNQLTAIGLLYALVFFVLVCVTVTCENKTGREGGGSRVFAVNKFGCNND